MIRIGHGYDVHRFGALQTEAELVIGGCRITYTRPLIAHSDGDVLVHAICDALLGACGLGDIGKHFPDTSPEFSNVNSLNLLARVVSLIKQHGYVVGNVDATIVAETPKMAPFVEIMCGNIAEVLDINITQVNVKATTTETLGFTGRKEGIAAYAVVLINKLEFYV